MEASKGLILVDVLIIAGAVALAVIFFWEPQHQTPVHAPEAKPDPQLELESQSQTSLPLTNHQKESSYPDSGS